MKNLFASKGAAIAAVLTIVFFSAVLIASCKKEENTTTDKCKNMYCLNGGTCVDGSCVCPTGYTGVHCEIDNTKSFIELRNNAPTTIVVDINGITRAIESGKTSLFTGAPGSNAHLIALTYGATTTGERIGVEVEWNSNLTYPAAGQTLTEPMDIAGSLFFLKIQNSGADNISGVYVNYGLTTQRFANVIIPNDGVTRSLGYFEAYSNSNVRALAQSSTNYWLWQAFGLTGMKNQVKTLVAH